MICPVGRIGRGRGETIAARAAQALVKALGAALLVALLVAPLAAAAPPTAAAAGATAQVAHIGAAADTQRLQLVLPLVADDVGLERFATAVSTPGSPSYGHYASIATLARRFGAPAAERRRVIGFLKASGATDVLVNATGMLAQATLSVGLAERLFGTLLSSFRAADGTPFVAPAADHRAASVAVPAALRGLVLGVVGLDTRPVVTHQRVAGAGGAAGGAGTGGLPGGAASAGVQRAPFHAASDYPTATGVPSGCSQGIGSGGSRRTST